MYLPFGFRLQDQSAFRPADSRGINMDHPRTQGVEGSVSSTGTGMRSWPSQTEPGPPGPGGGSRQAVTAGQLDLRREISGRVGRSPPNINQTRRPAGNKTGRRIVSGGLT